MRPFLSLRHGFAVPPPSSEGGCFLLPTPSFNGSALAFRPSDGPSRTAPLVFSDFLLQFWKKTYMMVTEIINAAAAGCYQHPTACVRVSEPLVHSGISRAATIIIVFLSASCKRIPQKRLISLRMHFVFLTDAVYETLIHRVYYFRREPGGPSPRCSPWRNAHFFGNPP